MRALRTLGAVVTVATTLTLAPIIPSDMKLLYSYQYDVIPLTAHPIGPDTPTFVNGKPTDYSDQLKGFVDDNGDGKISVSVFMDSNGNKVFIQIPETKYADMGKRTDFSSKKGYAANPIKEEYKSVFDTLVSPLIADAAIARDTSVAGVGTTGSSLTYSHTVTGTNPALFVGSNDGNEAVSGATYNSVAMTAVAAAVSRNVGSQDFGTVNLFYLLAPSTGANNVVVTKSGSVSTLNAWSSSYTGAQQCGSLDAVTATPDTAPGTTLTQNIITGTNNDWTVLFNANGADTITGTTGWTTLFISGAVGATAYGDSNAAVTPAGSKNYDTTRSGGLAHIGGFVAALKPFAACVAAATFSPWQFSDF